MYASKPDRSRDNFHSRPKVFVREPDMSEALGTLPCHRCGAAVIVLRSIVERAMSEVVRVECERPCVAIIQRSDACHSRIETTERS